MCFGFSKVLQNQMMRDSARETTEFCKGISFSYTVVVRSLKLLVCWHNNNKEESNIS